MVTTFTYKPSLVKIDARNFELSWLQTHTQTNTVTNQQTDRLQYTVTQLACSVMMSAFVRHNLNSPQMCCCHIVEWQRMFWAYVQWYGIVEF